MQAITLAAAPQARQVSTSMLHKGNYATIALLYDRMFGTLEKNPLELEDQATLTSE